MASAETPTSSTLVPPAEVDVVVVGAGPAGLMASLCLTTFGFTLAHFDNRSEPTPAGRADGIQPRTLEILRNIGGVNAVDEPGDVATGRPPFHGGSLTDTLLAQGVRVYEVAFWDPTETEPLARTSRAPSCPTELVDVVDNFTLLLHQGRIERAFLDEIAVRRRRLPVAAPGPADGCYRPFEVEHVERDGKSATYPVLARVRHTGTNVVHEVRAKYVVGCDGARSAVRRCVAGGEPGDGESKGKIRMEGDSTDIVWGVIDAQVDTDFPDLHYKCLIHSRDEGSIMVIPREKSLVRFYVQLQTVNADGQAVQVARDKATQPLCIERARKILAPFKFDVGHVDWFSTYVIGQRIASSYSLDHRIFLGGDATHTHSPSAGQGMNISMCDMYSLAWKLNLVEKGLGRRDVLLPSYELERRFVAEELLRFDHSYSRLFSGRSPSAAEVAQPMDRRRSSSAGAVDAQQFIDAFKRNARFTSGCGAVYPANALVMRPEAELAKRLDGAFNPPGCKLVAGERLPPARVVRVVDANQVDLQHEIQMDGAFRVHIFAGELDKTGERLRAFADHLASPASFLSRHRMPPDFRASIVDGQRPGSKASRRRQRQHAFFAFLTVVGTHYYDWDRAADLPPLLARDDAGQRVYCDCLPDPRVSEAGATMAAHRKYGVGPAQGAIIVVRPDGYVGATVGLDAQGWRALDEYFAGFLVAV